MASPDHLRVRVRAVAGILAAGILVGGAGAVVLRETGGWLSPDGAEAAATVAKTTTVTATATAVKTTGTKTTATKTTVTKTVAHAVTTPPATMAPLQGPRTANGTAPLPVQGPAPRGTALVARTTTTTTTTTSASVASAHPVESVAVRRLRAATNLKTPAVQTATPVEDQIHYQYNTIGRRDPFVQEVGSFIGSDVGGDAPVDVGGIKVVGIVWGADSFALVEDGRGNSLILRRGDKVMNGFVEDLKRDAMIVKLTMDGQSQSVAIPLTRKGDQTNAIR